MSRNKIAPTKPKEKKQPGIVAASYSGPLPPPNILEGYDIIYPGAAKTIIDTYIQEVNHRQSIEKEMIRIESDAQKSASRIVSTGQVLGFIICASFLGCGTYLVMTGHQAPGALFGGGSIAAIVAAFLYTRYQNHKSNR